MRAVSTSVLRRPDDVGRALGRGAAMQLAGRVLGLLCTLVTIHLAAGYLGVQRFGEFSLVTDMAALLAEIGVSAILAREIGRRPERTDTVAALLLGFRLTASLVVVALAMAVVPFLPYPNAVKHAMLIAFVGSLAGSIATFPAAIFQVNFRFDYIAASDLLARVAFLALISVAVVVHAPLTLFAVPFAVANIAQLVFSFALSRRYWRIGLSLDWRRSRELIRDAILIGLVALIGLLHFKADVLIMSLMRPARDVGIYSVAYRSIEQVLFLPLMLTGTLFPVLNRVVYARRTDSQLPAALVMTLFSLGLPVGIVLFALARPMVTLLASDAFERAAAPLAVLAFSVPFVFGGTILTSLLVITGSTRQLLGVPLVALVVNVGLNLYVVRHWGYMGAAVTTVATETLCFVGLLRAARRACSLRFPLDRLARIAAATVAGWGVVVATADAPALVTAAAGLAAWSLVLGLLRTVTRADVRTMRVLIGRAAQPPKLADVPG